MAAVDLHESVFQTRCDSRFPVMGMIAAILGLLVVVCGCAPMSAPIIDNAKPIPVGESRKDRFATQAYSLATSVDMRGKIPCPVTDFFNKDKPESDIAIGWHYGYGITDNLSVNVRLWSGGWTGDCYGKWTLTGPSPYLAVMPGFSVCWGQIHDELLNPTTEGEITGVRLLLPVAVTHEFEKGHLITLSAQYSHALLETKYRPDEDFFDDGKPKTYGFTFQDDRYGLYLNSDIYLSTWGFRPQVGVEYGETHYGKGRILLLGSLGVFW